MGTPIPLALVLVFLCLGLGWRAWVQKRLQGSCGVIVFRALACRAGRFLPDLGRL